MSEDINVRVKVTADIAELKEAIREFDNTEAAVKRLDDATKNVSSTIATQSAAIRTLQRARRVENYEILEAIRVGRSFVSVARDLNQVYQTLLLRSIDVTATTVKQRQAFDELDKTGRNAVDMLDVLGAKNEDVDDAFDSLIAKADSLNSVQLKDLISRIETYGRSASLSKEEQDKLNSVLKDLREILKTTVTDEDNKRFQDFFGIFTSAAFAAGSIGTFALKLAQYRAELTALAGVVSKFKPEIGIILALLFGKEFAIQTGALQFAGGGEDVTKLEQIEKGTLKGPDLTSRFTTEQMKKINEIKVEFNNNVFNSELDVDRAIDIVIDKIKRMEGRATR